MTKQGQTLYIKAMVAEKPTPKKTTPIVMMIVQGAGAPFFKGILGTFNIMSDLDAVLKIGTIKVEKSGGDIPHTKKYKFVNNLVGQGP